MSSIIINDCRDENAKGRQCGRLEALTNEPVTFIGVQNDLEAAGNLIDAIDAVGDQSATILVNVAPRNGAARHWGNGTPFCYFRYGKTLILASIDGYTLSLVKKFALTKSVTVLSIKESEASFAKAGIVQEKDAARIHESQFRSFDFLPRAAAYLKTGKELVGEVVSIETIPDAPHAIWWVDNFGNAKTTIFLNELPGETDSTIETKFGKLPFYQQLKTVPDKTVSLIVGSSGFGEKRFVEIVMQGGSAASILNLTSGQEII